MQGQVTYLTPPPHPPHATLPHHPAQRCQHIPLQCLTIPWALWAHATAHTHT